MYKKILFIIIGLSLISLIVLFTFLEIKEARAISSITVTSPNGGEEWVIGGTYNIEWENPDEFRVIDVDLYKAGDVPPHLYRSGTEDTLPYGIVGMSVSTSIVPPTSHTWTIPNNIMPRNDYKIRIGSDDENSFDESNSYFTIKEPVCADSDDGRDYYARGYISGICYDCTLPTFGDNSDSCVDTENLREFYCTDSEGWVREVIKCPNGCKDGACIKIMPDLVVEDFSLEYFETGVGGGPGYVYTGYVKNIGNSLAKQSRVKVSIDPAQIYRTYSGTSYSTFYSSTSPIPSNFLISGKILYPGQRERFSDYFNPTEDGSITISVTADINSDVSESNEYNNNFSETFNVKKVFDLKSICLPEGTLIKLPTDSKVYTIINCKKKWIRTIYEFQDAGYQWKNIKKVNSPVIEAYADYLEAKTNLFRAIGNEKVYRIINEKKLWVPTISAFNAQGLKWDDIQDVNETEANEYPRLKLARATDGFKVYYLTENGLKRWIPTEQVFNSYNNKWEDVVEINTTDLNTYPDSDLIRLESGKKVYKLENGIKRWIKTAKAFNERNYNWNNITFVNETELNHYPIGSDIE